MPTSAKIPHNPFLPEPQILDSLKQAPIGPYLQSNSMLVAVDAFDRRVEREWFIDTLAVVLDTGYRLGAHQVAASARANLAAGCMSDDMLAKTEAGLYQQLENNRTSLTRRMAALCELPWSTDTLH